MTNVSKQVLKESEQSKLFKQFSQLFANARGVQVEYMFSDLFTAAEKIMFMKRLAVILMVHEGFTTYRISKTLKVSESTVRSIRTAHEEDAYKALLRAAGKATFDAQKFWKVVEVLLNGGLPSRAGSERWKHVPGMGARPSKDYRG